MPSGLLLHLPPWIHLPSTITVILLLIPPLHATAITIYGFTKLDTCENDLNDLNDLNDSATAAHDDSMSASKNDLPTERLSEPSIFPSALLGRSGPLFYSNYFLRLFFDLFDAALSGLRARFRCFLIIRPGRADGHTTARWAVHSVAFFCVLRCGRSFVGGTLFFPIFFLSFPILHDCRETRAVMGGRLCCDLWSGLIMTALWGCIADLVRWVHWGDEMLVHVVRGDGGFGLGIELNGFTARGCYCPMRGACVDDLVS